MKVIYAVLLLLFIFDLIFSFNQFKYFALEGDFATIIIPSDGYKKVMENPLGWQVINHPGGYAQPNRYFEFKAMMLYFRNIPLWLQNFASPIESIYLSAALLKVITQFVLIYLIAFLTTGIASIFNRRNILVFTLAYPLFQTWGFQNLMAIIDPSITYAFAYATSTILVILFYTPFVLKYLHNWTFKFNWLWYLIFFLYSIVVNLNSSLNAPIILIISLIVFLGYGIYHTKAGNSNYFKSFFKGIFTTIPKPIFYIFIWASLTALYSLYIGTFNVENNWVEVPILERYKLLLKGINKQLFGNFTMSVFSLTIATQLFIFYKINPKKERFSKFIFGALIFIIIYMLLLPLGGYRSYRPFILRRDTFVPVLLVMITLFSFSSYHNWFILSIKQKYIALVWTFLILLNFTIADFKVVKQNDCEKRALTKITTSNDPIVKLEETCSVMSWGLVNNPEYSNFNMMLLHHYGIIKNPKQRYFHKPSSK